MAHASVFVTHQTLLFFADTDLLKRFEKVFEAKLALLDTSLGAKAITIVSFAMSRGVYPALEQVGMMLVDENWLPFEFIQEARLLKSVTSLNSCAITCQYLLLLPLLCSTIAILPVLYLLFHQWQGLMRLRSSKKSLRKRFSFIKRSIAISSCGLAIIRGLV